MCVYERTPPPQQTTDPIHRSPTTHTHDPSYEVNPDIVPELEAAGLRFTGRDETGRRMEILELAPPGDGGWPVGACLPTTPLWALARVQVDSSVTPLSPYQI